MAVMNTTKAEPSTGRGGQAERSWGTGGCVGRRSNDDAPWSSTTPQLLPAVEPASSQQPATRLLLLPPPSKAQHLLSIWPCTTTSFFPTTTTLGIAGLGIRSSAAITLRREHGQGKAERASLSFLYQPPLLHLDISVRKDSWWPDCQGNLSSVSSPVGQTANRNIRNAS